MHIKISSPFLLLLGYQYLAGNIRFLRSRGISRSTDKFVSVCPEATHEIDPELPTACRFCQLSQSQPIIYFFIFLVVPIFFHKIEVVFCILKIEVVFHFQKVKVVFHFQKIEVVFNSQKLR